jgi:hypothetical protein
LCLALLLASRLGQELSGPLARLGAALGESAQDPDALALARDAALVLRQRIALLRAAWGGEPAPLGRRALRDLAVGLPNAPRLQLEFDSLEDEPPFAPAAAQVVASALLLAAESLPGGGMLALAGEPGGSVVVTIAGPGAAWPAGLGAMLAGADAAWEAVAGLAAPAGLPLLPGAMTALLAHRAGARASLLLAAHAEAVPPLLLDFSELRGA